MTSLAVPAPCDLLVAGGTVVTMDDAFTTIEDGAVAVLGGEIVAVGKRAELAARYGSAETLDASGHVVFPGLVNAHTHAAMTLFRGLADDLSLEAWLNDHIWPVEAAFVDRDTVERGTTLACVEMLRGGVTTACDMYWFPRECAAAARRAGLRLVAGGALIDFAGADGLTPAERLGENRELLAELAGDPLVLGSIQPHSTYTASPDLLVKAKELADEFGVLYGLHVAETAAETAEVLSRYGRTPTRHLESLGLLGQRTVLFHGVHLDDGEIALLAARGASVVHCLESELKLASGIPRMPELLRAGVTVGLGTDGTASNNDLDLWAELRLAALLYKVTGGDPTSIPAREALRLATRGGAKALGMDHLVGSLEPGKRADLLLIDFDRPHLAPVYDVASHLAYAVNKADVATVVVQGKVVVRNHRVTTVDEGEAIARVREVAAKIALRSRPGRPG